MGAAYKFSCDLAYLEDVCYLVQEDSFRITYL